MITEEKQVIIAYDDSNDMIEITRGDECVFYGNEWNFHRDAKSLGRFLSSLGMDVKMKKCKINA